MSQWTQLGRRGVFCPFSPFCPRNNEFEKELISTGAKSQRKGRKAEIELSELLREHGIPAQVGDALNYGTQPDIRGVDGIHCECKRAETLRLSEWLAQATRDAERFGDGLPAVFFRRSRSPWCVVMGLEDWLTIYKGRCKCGGRCGESKSTGNPSTEH